MCGSPSERGRNGQKVSWYYRRWLRWLRQTPRVCGPLLFPAALTCVALLATLVSGCQRQQPNESTTQILRVAQRNEPGDLDPATATLPDDFGILRALCEGLLIPGPTGAPAPGAAARFDVSGDGLVYTFHLRPNARWSNGELVTAAHFVDSYRRLLTPATAAGKANVFYPVKNARAFVQGTLTDFASVGIQANDTYTLVVTLEQPYPRFPYYVMSGPWLPAYVPAVAQHGRQWTKPGNFVGNGPFTLHAWRSGQRIVVRKNPHWHGAAEVRLQEIQFIRFDSADTEERAYRTGQIHATMAVPLTKVESAARERPAELHRATMIETRYLSFNTRRAALQDPRVRRALAQAIDREAITTHVLKGGQSSAHRFIPPDLRSTSASTINPATEHRHDPQSARTLLKAAGVSAATFPRFEVTCWSSSQVPVLEAVQAMWRKELGLDVAIAVREAKVHLAALASGDYDIAFITSIPDVADAAEMLGDFVSGAAENYPQWKDPAFDAAFARGRLSERPDEAARALADAEERLLEAAAISPLYFNAKIWLMSPRVRGWQEDGLWSRCYQSVHLQLE